MDEILALDGGRSFGVLSRAVGAARGKTVVLLNAGLIHRTGPFRLHVHLARELAAKGFDVFRFDMPNIGDAPAGSHATVEAALLEVLDTVQDATGAGEIIVGGICSAADMGWKLAVHDRRVSGLLLLDGMAVHNHWFRIGQMGLLLKRPPAAWPGMMARFLKPKPEGTPGLMDFRDWPDHGTFKSQLAQMLERGVKVLALYSGGIAYYLLHPRQLDATFGSARRNPQLQIEYWPEMDHILFSPLDRQRTLERIREWSLSV
jgi:pimeloyl-ACP methyl ester carboxylesterase